MHLFESFRATRWIRTLNLVLQAVLFTTLCGGLNYLAQHYSWRTDLTHSRRYSLSPETLSYLKELTRPVRVVVTAKDGTPRVTELKEVRRQDLDPALFEVPAGYAPIDAYKDLTLGQ